MHTDSERVESRLSATPHPIDPMIEQVIREYSAGSISARRAAAHLGDWATEHDVFDLLRRLALRIPTPSEERMGGEIAAGLALYRRAATRTTRLV
jgi:hypothetical protein